MGGFCLFQWLKRKKNLGKKNNFQSYWNKYVRGGLSEVKWKKKNQQQNTKKKSPVLISSGRSNLTTDHFLFKLDEKQNEMFEMKICRFSLKISEYHLIFLYLPPT